MHAAYNSDFRCLETGGADPLVLDQGAGQGESGYYVVVPRRLRKTARASANPQATFTFGPYGTPHEARFIQISAHALGLLDLDAVS